MEHKDDMHIQQIVFNMSFIAVDLNSLTLLLQALTNTSPAIVVQFCFDQWHSHDDPTKSENVFKAHIRI